MRVTTRDWQLALTHPTTNRVIQPELLSEAQFVPSLNSLPTITAPIGKRSAFLRDEWDNADLEVFFEGEEAPIDEVIGVTRESGQYVLTGEGGTELHERVQPEYIAARPHIAAENLVTNNTSYATDFADPDITTLTDQVVQDASTTAELEGVFSGLDAQDDFPIVIENDEVTPGQVVYFVECEDMDLRQDDWVDSPISTGDFSDGEGIRSSQEGDLAEHTFTIDHDGEYAIYVRNRVVDNSGNPSDEYELRINGQTVDTTTFLGDVSLSWRDSSSVELEAGTVDIELQIGQFNDNRVEFDGLMLVDQTRGPARGDVDNTLHESSGHLTFDLFAETDFEADVHPTPFSVTRGKLEVTGNTDENQRLQVTNNVRDWAPSDGTEDNTLSVDVDFSTVGTQPKGRVRLGAHSPSGAQSASPRFGYAAQSISSWTLTLDIEQLSLLIDETFDGALSDVLTEIAAGEFVWSFEIVDGVETVVWTQPGQREASRASETVEASITKHTDIIESVTVKGSQRSVSDEQFSASHGTFVDLDRGNILPGSEAVHDNSTGENYNRGADYEMAWNNGQIKVFADGDISDSQGLQIDYRFEVEGTHTVDNADPNPRELVETFPGVVSETAAEQLGFVLAEVDPATSEPRYEASVRIPPNDQLFSAIEALDLALRDSDKLPENALPLAPRNIKREPDGLRVELGSEANISANLSELKNRMRRVERRS